MYKHILIPTDGSELSEAAAASGIRLAKALGARVTAVHVMPQLADAPLESWAQGDTRSRSRLRALFEQQAQQYLATVEKRAEQAGVRCTSVSMSGVYPYEGILQAAAEKRCDLIYMASHGRRGTSALVLGSETVKVLTHGDIPVLVHRGTAASRPSARRLASATRRRKSAPTRRGRAVALARQGAQPCR